MTSITEDLQKYRSLITESFPLENAPPPSDQTKAVTSAQAKGRKLFAKLRAALDNANIELMHEGDNGREVVDKNGHFEAIFRYSCQAVPWNEIYAEVSRDDTWFKWLIYDDFPGVGKPFIGGQAGTVSGTVNGLTERMSSRC